MVLWFHRVRVTRRRGFRADRDRLTHKEPRFTLIPEVRHGAAAAELHSLELLSAGHHTDTTQTPHRHHLSPQVSLASTRTSQLKGPAVLLGLGETTGGSASEEVKVSHRVHVHVVEVDFLIGSAIELVTKERKMMTGGLLGWTQ